MAGIPFRTILCALTIALSLSSVTAKPGPKINQYARRTRPTSASCDYKSWWKSCLFGPLAKHFEVIDSAHTLLRGLKKNNGYGTGFPSAPRTTKPRVAVSEPASAVSSHTRPTQKMDSFRSTSTPESLNPTPTTGSESDWSVVRKNLHRLETELCGVSFTNVTEGESWTLPGEFPWLALLQFKSTDPSIPDTEILCGGSLISDRYVLTAARCLDVPGYRLSSVRLGEYNLNFDEPDCSDLALNITDIIANEACYGVPPQDYGVSQVIVHPNYVQGGEWSRNSHDIGLIRLADKVKFTSNISPVCLPVGDLKSEWNAGNFDANLTVVGWRDSAVPQQASVPLLDSDVCKKILEGELLPGQMCIGDDKEGSPCHGDIGGPLFTSTMMGQLHRHDGLLKQMKSVQVGVLCSTPQTCDYITPTVFFTVERCLPWILSTMKP